MLMEKQMDRILTGSETSMQKIKDHFWGIGNIGEGVVSMVTSTYFLIFLTDTAMLPLGMVSAIAFIGSVLDFLLVPLSGAVLVSTKPMKWGRYRSWLLVCPPFVILFYLLCFTVIRDSQWMTAACALIGYVGGKTAWNIAYSSNVSLTAILSKKAHTTTKFTSQRMMGSNIGRMLGNSLTPALVASIAVHMGAANGYRMTILIMGAVYLVTLLIHFSISSSYDSTDLTEDANQKEKLAFREIVRVLAVEPRLFVTLVIDLTSNVASLVLPSLAVYYYKYFTTNPTLASTHMLIIGFGGLAGAALVRALGNKIQRPKRVLIFMYAGVALSLLSIRLFPDSTYYFLAIGAVIALITGMTSPVELTLYMDHTVHFQKKSGEDATGFIMGMSNLPVKFASVIKSTLIPFVLMSSGYVANAEATSQMKQAIIDAYTLIPAMFPICGIILLVIFYLPEIRKCSRTK